MSNAVDRGRFAWYDLMTTDRDGAVDFYSKLIGWGTQPFEGGEEPYTMFANGGEPLGGLMDLSPEAVEAGAPPSWLGYVVVPDVAAATERAAELSVCRYSALSFPCWPLLRAIISPSITGFGRRNRLLRNGSTSERTSMCISSS